MRKKLLLLHKKDHSRKTLATHGALEAPPKLLATDKGCNVGLGDEVCLQRAACS